MRIEELTVDQQVTIMAVIGSTQVEFLVAVEEVNVRKKVIFTTPIFREEKVVSFKNEGISTHLIVTLENKKPIVFRNVSIITMKKPDDTYCYAITSMSESAELNRRGSYRCFLGIDTLCRVAGTKTAYNITLTDISSTGFGFVCHQPVKLDMGTVVLIALNDFITETNEHYSFNLRGKIVRSAETENGRQVYGCTLDGKYVGLEPYIAKKERSNIQKKRLR